MSILASSEQLSSTAIGGKFSVAPHQSGSLGTHISFGHKISGAIVSSSMLTSTLVSEFPQGSSSIVSISSVTIPAAISPGPGI